MNILLQTTGCANSTIIIQMLAKLGWNTGLIDKFAESVRIRKLNHPAEKSGRLDTVAAHKAIADLPQPWVIKHPTFSYTIPLWMPVFEPYKPLLLWVTKDLEYVSKSMVRRFNLPTGEAKRRHDLCQGHFDGWPWGKMRLDVDQICSALKLFDAERAFKHIDIKDQ